MRIEKKYKPSFHRANARYRGVTDHSQYTNFLLESAHDLLLLSQLTTGNETPAINGQENDIYENFVSIMTGEERVAKAHLFTDSVLQTIDRDRPLATAPLPQWSPLNGATCSQDGDVYLLSSPGLLDPVGLYTTMYVESGDCLYIRMKVKSEKGAPHFSIGSNNLRVNGQIGRTKKIPIPAGTDFFYVDTILRCAQTQAIQVNINLHEDPDVLKATSVEVKDVSIQYLKEKQLQAASFDSQLKPALNELEELINSIR